MTHYYRDPETGVYCWVFRCNRRPILLSTKGWREVKSLRSDVQSRFSTEGAEQPYSVGCLRSRPPARSKVKFPCIQLLQGSGTSRQPPPRDFTAAFGLVSLTRPKKHPNTIGDNCVLRCFERRWFLSPHDLLLYANSTVDSAIIVGI